jgi:hypothetical protein
MVMKKNKQYNFDEILYLLKQGVAFRRDCWQEGVLIKMQVPDELSFMTERYLFIEEKGEKGVSRYPATLENEDILADDWIEVEEEFSDEDFEDVRDNYENGDGRNEGLTLEQKQALGEDIKNLTRLLETFRTIIKS